MTILIIVEIILLILVFSKLAYDVRHYNRTGELPWLARHLCLGYSYSGIKSGSGSSAMMNNDWYHHQDHLQDFQNQGKLSLYYNYDLIDGASINDIIQNVNFQFNGSKFK